MAGGKMRGRRAGMWLAGLAMAGLPAMMGGAAGTALLASGVLAPAALAPAALAQERPARPPERAEPPRSARVSLAGAYLSARFAEANKDYAIGADIMDRVLQQNATDPVIMFHAFRLRLAAGRVDKAIELAPQVLTVIKGDNLANLVLSLDSARKKDFVAAERYLAQLPSDEQQGFLRPYLLAWIKAGQGDFAAAQASLESVPTTLPNGKPSPLYLMHSALIDELAGNNDAAARKLGEIYFAPDGASLRSLSALVGFYKRHNKSEEAKALIQQFYEQNPDLLPLDQLQQFERGRARPLTVTDGLADVLFDVFAGYAAGAGDNPSADDVAITFGRLTMELRPDFDVARLLLGDLFAQQEQPDAAIEMYRTLEKSPLAWRARLRIAATLQQAERTEQAIALLKGMTAERPDRSDAPMALGDVLRTTERYAEAVSAYDHALARTPRPTNRHWVMFYARGIALERSKQWGRAETDLKKAMELNPDQPYVLNYLAYSWVDQGINLDDAKRMLEKAMELRPNDGAITDSLAWAYYRQGNYPRAVELLETAVSLQSTDPTINEHLGDAYWQVGRRLEARFQWQRALGLKPETDRIPELEKKIANGMASPDKAADGPDGPVPAPPPGAPAPGEKPAKDL